MAEWHVTPDYIVNNWTDELLDLMQEKLNERKERESTKLKDGDGNTEGAIKLLAARSGGFIKVVKQ